MSWHKMTGSCYVSYQNVVFYTKLQNRGPISCIFTLRLCFQPSHLEEPGPASWDPALPCLLWRLLGHPADPQRLPQVIPSIMRPLIPSQPPSRRTTATRLPCWQCITPRNRHWTIYAHSQIAYGAVVRSNHRRTTFRITSDPHGSRGGDRRAGRYTRLSVLPARVPGVFEVL